MKKYYRNWEPPILYIVAICYFIFATFVIIDDHKKNKLKINQLVANSVDSVRIHIMDSLRQAPIKRMNLQMMEKMSATIP